MSAPSRTKILEIYEAFSSDRLDQLAGLLDDNINFHSNAPLEVFPYLGRRIGKAEVLEALGTVHDEFDPITFLPIWILTDNDTASALLSVHATRRSTGRTARFFAAHFLRFRDERIVEYRSIIDSFEAVQQMLGREFDISDGTPMRRT